ncbi:ArsO family NAD(P)H-dependent flavin-containing monooxygenase [Marinobacter xestospongiae]|uniref:ArsO family NAD(P)H-dependent flavin-containing monooxygenase n=1 Tax=Marinobacter xestospongiae TaxID=994319 RepID=UPI002005AB52|nr:ArsO family NAD(P)H-dependent flavin-containing monooxygenase [Marinobacter xestospongiae]MCK7566256.1 ArsO family NAD(P)H-dependent flavin-containing monooxygenase [Marinobacter xestospongiae]
MSSTAVDVLVIGGGQAGLATGYFLRRHKLDYQILDREPAPGGAWRHGWDSLQLFSPAQWSSLPGWQMPETEDGEWPQRDEVIDYLARYQKRYDIPVERPVTAASVTRGANGLAVETDRGTYHAKVVVSVTGTWSQPFIPQVEGIGDYRGRQVHSAHYRRPEDFRDQRVLVVGGGNSGAQIYAEVSRVANAIWVTRHPPKFLPDDVDGRALFEMATEKWKAEQEDREYTPAGTLADIVMVPPVKEARERGVLETRRMFTRFTSQGVVWPDGEEEAVDAVIWCTGFRPALAHLEGLGVVEADGRVDTEGTRSVKEPRLWLVGYGDWTGFASATLLGVMRSARAAAREINDYLEGS